MEKLIIDEIKRLLDMIQAMSLQSLNIMKERKIL